MPGCDSDSFDRRGCRNDSEERLQPTELFPEMATLDCGTCNFGDEVFENTMPMMRDFGKRMLENRIKPEYECSRWDISKPY